MDASGIDKETAKLANEIRDLIGKHISKFDEEGYQEALTAGVIALAAVTGRHRKLCVDTGEVTGESFDQTFWEITMKHSEDDMVSFGSNENH